MGEGYVETNGIRLWYEDLGDPTGVPIVLIMGATASAITWPESLLETLTAVGHRVVRFDNRDIGLSTHIDYASAPYTIDDMADDTVGLLDVLDIDAAHFVGASMGGMISQVLALRHPARVRSLTLLITSPGPADERLSPSSDEVFAIAMRPADTDEELAERSVDLFRVLTGSRFPFDEAHYRDLAALDSAAARIRTAGTRWLCSRRHRVSTNWRPSRCRRSSCTEPRTRSSRMTMRRCSPGRSQGQRSSPGRVSATRYQSPWQPSFRPSS